jgi:pimeloyl-ACP methyl ester carboxylesterase
MFIAMLPGADRKVLARPEAKRIIMDMTREAVRNGIEGAMSDMSVFSRPWGVDPGQIRCPAVIWQGTEDSIVPDAVAFDLGQRIPGCTTHRLAGHGHFWIIEHVDDVLGAVDRMATAC